MTLDELERLCAEATKGRWRVVLDARHGRNGARYGCEIATNVPDADRQKWQSAGYVPIADLMFPSNPSSIHDPRDLVKAERQANAAFIAAAREWLPKLIAVAKAAEQWFDEEDKDVEDRAPGYFRTMKALAALHAPIDKG